MLRHYIVNILPNDLKAQLVAASRELAVQYVDALNDARDEIVAAIEGAADILKDIAPEDAQEAGGDVAFLSTALPYLGAIKALEFAAVISVDHNDLPHLKAWGGVSETKQRIERFKKPLSQDALAILMVKSKLLTGFDAKVEHLRYGNDDRDADLAELSARIVQHLREESAVSGFWDNPVSQEEARRWIFQHLDNRSIFDFGDLDAIASDCMGVARANRAAFTS